MQEIYAIYGISSPGTLLGTLYYDNETGNKYVEVPPGLVARDLILYFSVGYTGETTHIVGNDMVDKWISGRVPPPYRQDLGDVLRGLGLTEYDQWKMFLAYRGKSWRDDFYIEQVN